MAEETGVIEVMLQADLKRFDKALAKARRLPCDFHRTWCLFYIASRELDAQQPEPARQLLNEALAAVGKVRALRKFFDINYHYYNLWTVYLNIPCYSFDSFDSIYTMSMPQVILSAAIAQEQAGQSAEALVTVHTLEDAVGRASALTAIAAAGVKAGHADRVRPAIAEAKTEARKVEDVESKRKVLTLIASIEGKSGLAATGPLHVRRGFAGRHDLAFRSARNAGIHCGLGATRRTAAHQPHHPLADRRRFRQPAGATPGL